MFFVLKPAHFEFQSYGADAWHEAKIVFVKKYMLILCFFAI